MIKDISPRPKKIKRRHCNFKIYFCASWNTCAHAHIIVINGSWCCEGPAHYITGGYIWAFLIA